ncbi:hypothetical protein G6F42_013879 [Rhizopus arrhizus]|nr:hypothetical protein G6F42_013879 [Rhizopus arrhizus]
MASTLAWSATVLRRLALENDFLVRSDTRGTKDSVLKNSDVNLIDNHQKVLPEQESQLVAACTSLLRTATDKTRVKRFLYLHRSQKDSAVAEVMLPLVATFHQSMNWSTIDEDMFVKMAIDPFLDAVFQPGGELEVKTSRSKLDDTEKLGAELKAMAKRMAAAEIENAEAFGVVAQGFSCTIYKMIMPASSVFLLLDIGGFSLPKSIDEFEVFSGETTAVLLDLKDRVMAQAAVVAEAV